MSFLFTSRATARDPYSNHSVWVPVGLPRCARNVFSGSAKLSIKNLAACAVLAFGLSTSAFSATNLTGKVTNGTTGKPAAGNEVILLKLSEGMQEEARTKSDAQGRFELPVQATDVPHLVRVVHQKVNYHRPAPPGTSSVEVQVFDSAAKLEGISANVDLMRVQAQGGSLQVTEMVAVKNESKPPRTLMSERTLDIYLPEGAQIETSLAAGPGGMPVNSAPVPVGKGHYGFIFPLRPGETRFQVSYRLPYSGEAEFKPRVAYKVDDFAVMLPKSMEFTATTPGTFNLADDQGGVVVQMVKNIGPGSAPGFRIKGTGTLPDDSQQEQAGGAGADNRPGGGIGQPSELPDPLQAYRWYVLSSFLLTFGIGAGVAIYWRTLEGRRYRALLLIAAMSKVVAGFWFLSSGIAAVILFKFLEEWLKGSIVLVMFAVAVEMFVPALLLWAAAEAIYVFLDIEANTRAVAERGARRAHSSLVEEPEKVLR